MKEIIKLHCDIGWKTGLTEEFKEEIRTRFTGKFIESNYGDMIINKVSFEHEYEETEVDVKAIMKRFTNRLAVIVENHGMLTESFMKDFNQLYEEEEKKW